MVRAEEGVPRAETIPVEEALDDQGRLFLLERVAHFAEEANYKKNGIDAVLVYGGGRVRCLILADTVRHFSVFCGSHFL